MIHTQSMPVDVAALRSWLYSALAQAFMPPQAEMLDLFCAAETHEEFINASRFFVQDDQSAAFVSAWQLLRHELLQLSPTDYEAEYLQLFEVGIPQAPCALYESAYGREDQRREIMAELVRFYNHFDLSMGERAKEMPDHLHVQLEFLHYLTFLETQALEEGKNPQSLRLAQHDFHARHIANWTPQLWQCIDSKQCDVFKAWAKLAQAFFAAEDALLKEAS
jgi:DMSO reductase family type II enzyme chaperone